MIKSNLFKQLLVSVFLSIFIMNTNCFAYWDPEYCLTDQELYLLEDLKNPKYKELQAKVLKYLENTWCSREKAIMLMDLMIITKPQFCVEVGVFAGSSLFPVAATLKYLNKGKVYAIDAWSNEAAVIYLEDDDVKSWWGQVNLDEIYKNFQKMINQWSLNAQCKIIHDLYEKAISKVPMINFLHLDGNF